MSRSESRTRRTVAFIPARGGSKAIPLKNIAVIAGQPLIYWTVRACSESRHLEQVFVATDEQRIRVSVDGFGLTGVTVVSRSPESATDEASSEIALLEFAKGHSFDYVVFVQPTSPLLTAAQIDEAIDRFFSTGADSLISVVRTKRFFWDEKDDHIVPENYDPRRRPRRQEWSGQLVENGALYLTSREKLLASGCRVSGRITAYEMPADSYFELDNTLDRKIMELLLRERRSADRLPAHTALDVKLFCVDVDGTLTDGGMYYGAEGELLKRFDTRDAVGMRLIERAGIDIGIVSSEDSPIVSSRAAKLGIEAVHIGVKDKEALIERLLKDRGLGWKNLAFVGDDLNDLGVLRRAGFSASPSDAAPEVLHEVTYVCGRPGGRGAVREVCDLLMRVLGEH